MKVAFAGTPDFAATILRGLLGSEHEVGLVISQPDTRRGRGRRFVPTPVSKLALELDLPLACPENIGDATPEISGHDALAVAAYGQILRSDSLYAARYGAWNVHASLLPAYRGAAPIERAIMAGEKKTGVTIIQMDEGLDTGPIALQREMAIPLDMTGGELSKELSELGSKAIVKVISALGHGDLNLTLQNNLEATYAAKLLVEELNIKWDRGVREVHNLIRALAPHIGARAHLAGYGGAIKLLRSRISQNDFHGLDPGQIYTANSRLFIGCAMGAIEILELQVPGKRAMSVADFLRGNDLTGAFYW